MESALYEGAVQHRRRKPVEHGFRFRLFMLYLDLGELTALTTRGGPLASLGSWLFSSRGPALAWFRRRDHLGPADVPLDEHVRGLVAAELGRRPTGPVRLLTHLRYWGLVFNPVSFYYCFDAAGELDAVVADVTNTPWGERHVYVVDARRDACVMPKTFHVSPFMGMEQVYRWRFAAPDASLRMSIESSESDGQALFGAHLQLERQPLTRAAFARALLRYPWMTAQVVLGIYWQAFRLWRKGAVFHSHPRHHARSEASA